MSFTDLQFLAFFAIVLAVYWAFRKKTFQNIVLLVASYVFYGWVHPWYCLLLAAGTVLDYFLVLGMNRFTQQKRIFLAASLLANIGLLAAFKYVAPFSRGVAFFFYQVGLDTQLQMFNVLLPVGISFYTFKRLSYIFDVYRGTYPVERTFTSFALFVAFLPQVVAGPIERAGKLLPQINQPRRWDWARVQNAWPLLVMGFLKKIVIADNVAVIVNKVYLLEEPSKLLLLVGSLGFTLQILADFSAYTDLSRGFAYLLGFDTSENFHNPYLSLSPSEFWTRWHITLSNWLRDYIFFPLRRTLLRHNRQPGLVWNWLLPPLVTMLVSGFWHGSGWTFMLWGLFHGLLIAIYNRVGVGAGWRPKRWWQVSAAWLVMFLFTVFSWTIFRSNSLAWLGNVIFHAPLSTSPADWTVALVSVVMIACYAAPLVIKLFLDRYGRRAPLLEGAFYALAVVLTIIYTNSASNDFIYFQF